MAINRQYKDSVFSLLFSDPAALRELYEAIEGVTLPPDTPITINTLEGVLYRNLLNDVSFLVGHKLILLAEHQSTVNPNMALRILLYMARLYEILTADKNLYSRKKIAIPAPECFVLYNGTEPYPDEATLKLSDLFEDTTALGIPQDKLPSLELTVKVININKGRSEGVVSRSETLNGYSTFIAKVREYEAETAEGRLQSRLSDEEKRVAMQKAIDWCVAHNTLKNFLEGHKSEVVNMLMTEWNLEDALVVERAEGLEEGREVREIEIARTALAEGISFDIIHRITGLDVAAIESLSASV